MLVIGLVLISLQFEIGFNMGYLYLCCVYLLFVLSEVVWVSLAVQMALITLEGGVEIFYLCCVFIVCT